MPSAGRTVNHLTRMSVLQVLSGMEVVDTIAAEPTTSVSGIGNDVPSRGVILESATTD